jgi:hypothetical protein
MLRTMPIAAPFPHLDALESILARAAGAPETAPERLGRALFPAPYVTTGTLVWGWEHAHRVVHEWARWTREMPHDVTSVARIARVPHVPTVPSELRGRAMVAIEVAIPREPWIASGRLVPLRKLEPAVDTVAVTSPEAVHPLHTSDAVPAPAIGFHAGLEALPAAAIDAFLAMAGPHSGANLLSASLQHLGPAYGLGAFGLPVDDEDAAGLEIRLELLHGRLLPFMAGRPAVEDIVRAFHLSRAMIRGQG